MELNMKQIIAILALCLGLMFPGAAFAHTLWVNVYESFSHKPGHIISSLGWGHVVPMDDVFEHFDLASYFLVDPEMSQVDFPLPAPIKILDGESEVQKSLRIVGGDTGVHKMSLKDDAKKGTYQVAAVSRDNFYSTYIDMKGRHKWKHTTMDKVHDAKKVIRGMKFTTYAKSFFTIDQWTQPSALGFDLEILPLTDLSRLRAGEMVEFDVKLLGRSLNTVPDRNFEYMTLTSNTFGGPDGFTLATLIFNGKASFRIPTAGQWVANIYTRQAVTPDGPLKALVGKCTNVLYAATVSFNVKP